MDLNYTQNIPIAGLNLQLIGDIYNVTDNQTGYNPRAGAHNTNFGVLALLLPAAALPARGPAAVLIRTIP